MSHLLNLYRHKSEVDLSSPPPSEAAGGGGNAGPASPTNLYPSLAAPDLPRPRSPEPLAMGLLAPKKEKSNTKKSKHHKEDTLSPPLLPRQSSELATSSTSTRSPHQQHQSLEEISSYLISQLKKKPQKERALRDALELQDRLHALEEQTENDESDTRKKKRQLEEEIEELERKKAETKKAIERLANDAEKSRADARRQADALRTSPGFRSASAIERMSREIDQLNFHASKVRTVTTLVNSDIGHGGEDGACDGDADSALLCPVCLSVPGEQVLTCQQCDNMICGECRSQLSACPTCRKSFKSSPPRRNRLVERIIASTRR